MQASLNRKNEQIVKTMTHGPISWPWEGRSLTPFFFNMFKNLLLENHNM